MVALQKISPALLLGALAPVSRGLATDNYGHRCRCRPHQPCWPRQYEWQAFNASIDGSLVAVRPVAHACHEPGFDAAACNASASQASNSAWRASQPGAVQWTNWEAWPERNESCYLDGPRDTPCGQGQVSLFSALVAKAEHIQAAVRFAARHDLRLAIKNSGHCFLGRSSAPESLQISTNKLKSIQFTNRFLPAGAPRHHPAGGSAAVTIGAGVNLKELYSAAAKHNVTLVAGLAHTVGAAGGYIQGGGHSPLGTWKGMASDNALEFIVVNAKGDLVTANDYQNQDLFWALRGGGGSTFGVVVSVTIRTFPDVPAAGALFVFAVPKGNVSAYWDMVRDFHAHLPAISDAGGCGYYFVSLKPENRNGTEVMLVTGGFLFPNETQDKVHKVTDALAADMHRHAMPGSVYIVDAVPRVSEWIVTALQGDADTTGGIVMIGSRMISRDLLAGVGGPRRLADALKSISESDDGVGFTGHVVAGGAVAKGAVDSALNPAWRRTLTHIAFGVDWNSTTSAAEQKRIQGKLTTEVEKLRVLEPDMGAYLNEANAYEKDFQRSFWGDNYKRLYDMKQKLDPTGLFIARKGVGSEDWDDAGLCKVGGHRPRTLRLES